jgi:excinuclease ABC subunit C
VSSELDNIKGIGEKTKLLLIRTFKSIKRIKEADFQEIANLIGKAKAELVINSLKK